MFKSTITAIAAAALLSTSATAQTYYSAPSGTPIATDCAGANTPEAQFTNSNNDLIIKFRMGASCAAVSAPGSPYTALDATAAATCFNADGTANAGTNAAICPAKYGSHCTAVVKYCQTDDKLGTECGPSEICLWPLPAKALQSRAVFPTNRSDYSTPNSVRAAIVSSMTKNCPVYGKGGIAYQWTSDKGKAVILGSPIVNGSECDADQVEKDVSDAVGLWNEDPANVNNQYPVQGIYTVESIPAACWDNKTGSFICAADDASCPYLCEDGYPCTDSKTCGVKCAKIPDVPGKVCVSDAITSAAGVAVAMVAAMALFF